MRTRRARLRSTTAVAVLLMTVAAVAGCSAGGGDGGGTTAVAPEPAEAEVAGGDGVTAGVAGRAALEEVGRKEIVATGNVAVRSTDVAAARRDVQAVVDRYRGEVQEAQTETDRDGEPVYARLVVRVPTADFDAAMADLEDVGVLVSSDRSAEDVTTEVIDTEVRVRVQRRSIARIEQLLDRATSIADIVAVERQLAERQAELASLEQRHEHLADRTAMATVTVSVERVDGEERETDEAGFLAGLEAGWTSLRGAALLLATVSGALLPWLPVLALLGLPAWLVLRRRARPPEAPAAGQP